MVRAHSDGHTYPIDTDGANHTDIVHLLGQLYAEEYQPMAFGPMLLYQGQRFAQLADIFQQPDKSWEPKTNPYVQAPVELKEALMRSWLNAASSDAKTPEAELEARNKLSQEIRPLLFPDEKPSRPTRFTMMDDLL